MRVLKNGVMTGELEPKREPSKAQQLRIMQRQADQELADLKAGAIDYFMRGETYPIELQTYADSVKGVIDAKPADPLPTLPERPVIEATAEGVKLG